MGINKINGILFLFALFLTITFTGCETPIDVDLPEYESKLVIEGSIENGEPAVVFLSKSIPFFSEVSLDYLMNNVAVADATVTVTSSDGESERLTFQYYPDAPLYFAFVSRNLIGRENTSYTLTVEYGEQTYTAETTIPHTFSLDSAWFAASLEYLNADSMRTIRIQLSDNPTENNYYSFQTKVSCPDFTDRLWASSVPLAFDDKTFNGNTIQYEIERFGIPSLILATLPEDDTLNQTRLTYRPGDTVYLKSSQMDYNTYRFMITGGNEAIMGSNPFTNPAPVISNIQGENVLGCWCGFASTITRLVWPDTVGYYDR